MVKCSLIDAIERLVMLDDALSRDKRLYSNKETIAHLNADSRVTMTASIDK